MKLLKVLERLLNSSRSIRVVKLRGNFVCIYVDNSTKVIISDDIELNLVLHELVLDLLEGMDENPRCYSCKWIAPWWLSEMYEEDKLLDHTNVITVTNDCVTSNVTITCVIEDELFSSSMLTEVYVEDVQAMIHRKTMNEVDVVECSSDFDIDVCPKEFAKLMKHLD